MEKENEIIDYILKWLYDPSNGKFDETMKFFNLKLFIHKDIVTDIEQQPLFTLLNKMVVLGLLNRFNNEYSLTKEGYDILGSGGWRNHLIKTADEKQLQVDQSKANVKTAELVEASQKSQKFLTWLTIAIGAISAMAVVGQCNIAQRQLEIQSRRIEPQFGEGTPNHWPACQCHYCCSCNP